MALLVTFACAGQSPKTVAKSVPLTSPSPAASPSPETAVAPAPASAVPAASTAPPAPPPVLTLSGALAANVTRVSTSSPCARVGGSYYVRDTFTINGAEYALTLTIASYAGARTYLAPPARVSLRPMSSAQPVLYTGTSGRVVVNGDERSGSMSENLESQSDKIHVDGSWNCP